jgi:xylose isomerase
VDRFTSASAAALLAYRFDREELGRRPLPYERLDQLTVEILLGVR